jgi:carboxyl-terminal processing protease
VAIRAFSKRIATRYESKRPDPFDVSVDGNSASEIFAVAIQDNGRGLILGEKSYGKGTVQTHFPLKSVRGKLRLTTARFYSPEGRVMSGAGVTPDVRVSVEDNSRGDEVLARAIRVARSREVFELAEASRKCRIRNSAEQTDSMMGPLAKLGK